MLGRYRLLFSFSQLQVGITKVIMGHRLVWFKSNSFLESSDSLVVIIHCDQQTAEICSRLSVVRLQLNCLAIRRRGFRMLIRHVVRISKIVVGVGKVGLGGDGL